MRAPLPHSSTSPHTGRHHSVLGGEAGQQLCEIALLGSSECLLCFRLVYCGDRIFAGKVTWHDSMTLGCCNCGTAGCCHAPPLFIVSTCLHLCTAAVRPCRYPIGGTMCRPSCSCNAQASPYQVHLAGFLGPHVWRLHRAEHADDAAVRLCGMHCSKAVPPARRLLCLGRAAPARGS